MIYYCPLEHIETRYTQEMDVLIQRELQKQGKKYKLINGKGGKQAITNKKDFLNSTGTNKWRFDQLKEIATLFEKGKVKDGDIFFFSDIWGPGIESIPYMAYFNGVKVKIMGFLHAGSFTRYDMVYNLRSWARPFEESLFALCDKIFVGSSQPVSEIYSRGYEEASMGKFINTGLPMGTDLVYDKTDFIPFEEREDLVVFGGRLADEKQPWLFDQLAKRFPQYKFIKTLEVTNTKKEYLDLLAKAKVFVSFALEETYGIGAVEASTLGTNILLPARLSYLDFYPKKYLYTNEAELDEKLVRFISEDNSVELGNIARAHDKNVEKLVKELV